LIIHRKICGDLRYSERAFGCAKRSEAAIGDLIIANQNEFFRYWKKFDRSFQGLENQPTGDVLTIGTRRGIFSA
jgi:hypothetical protein